jgi:hypothetical protein
MPRQLTFLILHRGIEFGVVEFLLDRTHRFTLAFRSRP